MIGVRVSLVAVGQPAELLHGERLLLDVVLSEEPRLASHHLLNGRLDDEVVDVVVGASGLPAFRRDHLRGDGPMIWFCFSNPPFNITRHQKREPDPQSSPVCV